jgi:hypothetical protein
MEERQRLINQYLQLNIQMLEKEIKESEKTPEEGGERAGGREGAEAEGGADSLKKKMYLGLYAERR